MKLPLFGFEGMVWADKKRTRPLGGDYYIRVVNKRNHKWDADALGVVQGTFASDGHYSLCLADLKGNDAVRIGDELDFYLFKKPDKDKRLFDLKTYKVTQQDMNNAGVAIDFIAEGISE